MFVGSAALEVELVAWLNVVVWKPLLDNVIYRINQIDGGCSSTRCSILTDGRCDVCWNCPSVYISFYIPTAGPYTTVPKV
jgi:hypothetical protein